MAGVNPYLVERLRRSAPRSSPRCRRWPSRPAAINLGQGFPDTDGPAEVLERRGRRDPRRPQPVPAGHRHRRAARTRSPRTSSGSTASTYDPDTEVLVTAGATEAIAAALLALCEPGDEVVTFEPYYDSYAGVHRDGRRRRGASVTLRTPDYRSIPTSCARAITPRTKLHPAQLAAQPDRQGVHARRARARSPTLVRRARPDRRSPTRSTSTSCSTGEHVPLATLPGHARAHGHDLVGRQDVLVHRLEDRLGVRAARARRPRCDGQAVPHLRERRAVPAGDRGRARPARRRTSPASPPTCATKRDRLCAGLARRGLRRATGRTGTYFVTVDIRSLGETRRPGVLPFAAASAAAWWRSRASCSTTTSTPAVRSCGSRAASASRCSTRPSHRPARSLRADEGRRASSTTSCGRTATRTSRASRR